MRPNIVFIMADDLGYADLSCYGRRDFSTPNIDRIAASGVRFTQAYANSAVCSATRARADHRPLPVSAAVGLEEPLAGKTEVGLPPEHPTLPSLLRKAGYATALIGKWHLGVLPAFGPLQSGYDHFWGFRSGARRLLLAHGTPAASDDLWDGDVPIQQTGYLTDLLGDRAVATIERMRGPSARSCSACTSTRRTGRGRRRATRRSRERLAAACATTTAARSRPMRAWSRRWTFRSAACCRRSTPTGCADNTIVIFTSDNGGERFSDTWPFTGMQDRTAGRRSARAGAGLLARPHAGRPHQRAGDDHHGLASDAAGRRRRRARPGLSAGRHQPAAGADRTARARAAQAVLALQDQRAAGHARRRLQVSSRSATTPSCSTSWHDPRERANLKDRRKDVFDRLVAEWDAWNAAMLPEIPDSFGEVFTAADLADHIGA